MGSTRGGGASVVGWALWGLVEVVLLALAVPVVILLLGLPVVLLIRFVLEIARML